MSGKRILRIGIENFRRRTRPDVGLALKQGGFSILFMVPTLLCRHDPVMPCPDSKSCLGSRFSRRGDAKISFMETCPAAPARLTADYSVFNGEGRDAMMFADAPPMKAYSMSTTALPVSESQQGFSGFTTWTERLA